MKQNTKRWIISTILTFLGGFIPVLLGEMDSITLETFRNGSYLGIIFIASRQGIKAILEAFIYWKNK